MNISLTGIATSKPFYSERARCLSLLADWGRFSVVASMYVGGFNGEGDEEFSCFDDVDRFLYSQCVAGSFCVIYRGRSIRKVCEMRFTLY